MMARKNDDTPVMAPDEAENIPTQEISDEEDLTTTDDPKKQSDSDPEASHANLLKRFWCWCAGHKKLSIPLTVLVLAGLITAIPPARYAAAGLIIKQDFTVTVRDAQTDKPVSSAAVTLAGKTLQTNNKGQAMLRVSAGKATLSVSKKYYKSGSQSVTVPILKKGSARVRILATGRQVPVVVINKISGKPLANVTVKAEGSEVKTDKDGKVTIVLPAGKDTIAAALTATGYNVLSAKIQVTTSAVPANTFSLVPSGKLYFLSNASGKIDVVKSNLDGSGRETVLAGTGKEDKSDTVMLASRDWKYLALSSKREGTGNPKLYLIETANDAVTTMDEGNATFTLAGWSDHHFVYRVNRNDFKDWQPKQQAIKSFDATSKKLTVLDETEAEGGESDYVRETFGEIYLVSDTNGQVAYSTAWTAAYNPAAWSKLKTSKQASLMVARADGTAKKAVKTFAMGSDVSSGYVSISLRSYAPNEIYIQWNGESKEKFFEYEDGQVKEAKDVTNESFWSPYPTYLQSPAGDKTFWSEPRDGKNTLFVGNAAGEDQKQVMALSEYQTYGWYTDNYFLLSKSGSELYILAADSTAKAGALKLTDYYKPISSFAGYGGGYGGL